MVDNIFGGTMSLDDQVIDYMSKISGVKYSSEQLDILKHHGGMCILASAGSGKTSILTHLIAKRIQTHEIADTTKLLCTTFSRGGAQEMDIRTNELLGKLGIKANIQFKTMHATYLQLLKDLGYNFDIVDGSTKMRYIREACKECDITLEDDDYQTLESLFGYQINNLLSDENLFKSYVYTLRETIPIEKYSAIRQLFNNKKTENNCMDFDDMQLVVLTLLKSEQYGEQLKQYCHSLWHYIYVDEAQDISKIQFEILKCLITDPNNLVFIGDDDQCLIRGTKIITTDGIKNIEDIKKGDSVLTGCGNNKSSFNEVIRASHKLVNTEIYCIKTKTGKVIKGTFDHKAFALSGEQFKLNNLFVNKDKNIDYYNISNEVYDYMSIMNIFDNDDESQINKSKVRFIEILPGESMLIDEFSSDKLSMLDFRANQNIDYANLEGKNCYIDKFYHFVNNIGYREVLFCDLKVGYHVPIYDKSIKDDEIISIEKERYDDYVYDITIPDTRNFIANGVVVHNCIYEWRGADPSIILNICGVYTDLTLMTLTTNYRCLGNIVDKAANGIKFNRTRSNKTMKPYKDGGDIKICDCKDGTIYDMSKYAFKYIKKLIIDDGVMPSNIAVLSRNNAHLTILNNMLFKEGIYCKCADEMKLTKSSMFKLVEGVIQMGQNTTSGNVVANNLWKCCRYMKRADSKIIGSLQSAYGLPIKDTIGLLLTQYGGNYGVEWENPGIKISKMDYGRYSDFVSRLSSDTINSLIEIYDILTNENQNKAIESMLYMFIESKSNLFFKSEESQRYADGFVDYLIDLFKEVGIVGYHRYIKAVEQFESGGMAIISPMITMSTMHGAKGKEWQYVILFADDNVSFPSFNSINTCLEDGVPTSDIHRMIDEDRRLHYVAMTRAKEHLIIFANRKNLSVYTMEALDIMPYDIDNNSNIISMAQHGLSPSLIDKTNEEIFSNESKYFMSIDVNNLETHVEEMYTKELNENKNDTGGFNINTIQTFAPQMLGSD